MTKPPILTKEQVETHEFIHTMYSRGATFFKCHIKAGVITHYTVGQFVTSDLDTAIKEFNGLTR